MLAILWASSGYFIGLMIEYSLHTLQIDYDYQVALMCGSINLIVGLIWLKFIIRDTLGDQMFFVGPIGNQDGDIRVGCLWSVPFVMIIYGLLGWIIAFLLRLVTK